MSPKKKPSDDTTPDEAATPPPTAEAETVQTPATEPVPTPAATATSTSPRFTRGVIAAGAAGLLVAGLAGFGIGRATGDDGPQFSRVGQIRPGGPGWDNQEGPRGNRGDQRQDDGRFPPMPQGGPQDVQPNTQGDQPPADGSGNDTSGT